MFGNTVSCSSKAEKVLFNSQSLSDRKQCQINNAQEKKKLSSIDISTSDDRINLMNFASKNYIKKFGSNNIPLLSSVEYETTLVNSEKSIVRSLLNYKNDSRITQNHAVYSNITSGISNNEEIDLNRGCTNQLTEDATTSLFSLDCSSSDIIQKFIPYKLDSEFSRIKDSDLESRKSTISTYDRDISDIISDLSNDSKRSKSDLNVRVLKTPMKKSKRGVDSLLEKLETNKKLYNNDGTNLTVTQINIDERDNNSVKSMSPEYCKTRSPNYREYDVVSPTFSNEDSNERRQRRKRKLGKPIRLAKDMKLEPENIEAHIVKAELVEQPRTLHHSLQSNQELFPESSLFKSYKEQNSVEKVQLDSIKESNQKIYLRRNQSNKIESDINDRVLNKNDIYICRKRNYEKPWDSSNENFKGNDNLSSHQYLKGGQYTKVRSSSECCNHDIDMIARNKKKRRKSCNDILEGLNKLDSKLSISTNLVTFNEVELQLEKMFAGIIESDKDLLKKNFLNETRSLVLITENEKKENFSHKTHLISSSKRNLGCVINNDNYKKPSKKSTSTSSSYKNKSGTAFSKMTHIPDNIMQKDIKSHLAYKSGYKKSNISQRKRNKINIENFQEVIYESALSYSRYKYKGPIIQIRGSKNCSLHVKLINVPREDDEERLKEKKKTNINTIISRGTRLNYQNVDYRGKVHSSGLIHSALSSQYNEFIADLTWICVFCKKGPHCLVPPNFGKVQSNSSGPPMISNMYTMSPSVLSDLFGPYFIENNYLEDHILSSDDLQIANKPKEVNRRDQVEMHAEIPDQFSFQVRQKKCSNNINNISLGMEMLYGDQTRWEVWVHEQCIVWTAGVYINGGRINGLQDAVWESARTLCNYCDLYGANIKCIRRGCKSVVHYCCALTSGWYLDVNLYIPECNNHIVI